MRRLDFTQLVAYSAAAFLAVGSAFLISIRFLAPVRAQSEAPAPTEQVQPTAEQQEAPSAGPANDSAQEAQPAGTETKAASPDPAAGQPQARPSGASGISEIEGFLEPFIYDIASRRDPFQPYAEFAVKEESRFAHNISPAQRWELEQLKLVGIMWDIRNPRAMFLDPEQDVMILGRDESIGKRNGYIAAIREGEVVVVEAIRKKGDVIYKTKVLRIER